MLLLTAFIASSVMISAVRAQADCVECFPAWIGLDAEEGCSEEVADWAFSPEASSPCSNTALDANAFVEDLRNGWVRHEATTSIGLGPDGAIRLYGLSSLGYAPSDYFTEISPLEVQELPSGRVRITGEVQNQIDPDLRWALHIVLDQALPAGTWLDSHPDHELVLAYGCDADTNALNTFVLDAAHSHLTATGGYEAGFLQLSHMPVNAHRRFQLGPGGSSHNCAFGLGGWFAWSGQINGDPVLGLSGDLIVDLANAETVLPTCGDAVGLGVATAFNADCNTGGSVAVAWTATDETPPSTAGVVCPADTVVDALMPESLDELSLFGEAVVDWTDNCTGPLTASLSFADVVAMPGDCQQGGAVTRTFVATATDGCGNSATSSCAQTIAFTSLPDLPGIEFPGDTTLSCDATDPEDLPAVFDACGVPLSVSVVDVAGPAAIVLEESFAANFAGCSLAGFVAAGGATSLTEDGPDGSCAATLEQYVGMLPNNFFPNVQGMGLGTYEVMARTNSLTSDVLVKLFAGPGIVSPALIFSIRPSGSDNPGVNVLGYGAQSATTAPPVQAQSWFAIRIDVLPDGIALYLDDALWWTGPLPEDLPESGYFKLGAAGSATFDDLAYTPHVACPNDYTLQRTWTATDAAGNVLSHTQHIVVVDDVPPVLEAPAQLTWPCGAGLPTAAESGWMATDCGDLTLAVEDSLLTAGGACAGSQGPWLRTFTATDACANTTTLEQVIDLEDATPPIGSAACGAMNGDTLTACPGTENWEFLASCAVAWTDDCSDDMALEITETQMPPAAICGFSDPAPLGDGLDCDGFVSHGMRLFNLTGLPGGEFYTTTSGTATQLADGRLQLEGRYENMDLASGEAGFDLIAAYSPGMTWAEWSAQTGNPGYLYTCGESPDLHEDWMYHVMDSAVLTGWGAYAGTSLNLYHQPPNAYYGLQLGEGASSKNAENGFVAWFTFEGEAAGQTVNGSGDFFADLSCDDSWSWTRTTTATDCAGNLGTFSYTLLVDPTGCEPPTSGLTGTAPAETADATQPTEPHWESKRLGKHLSIRLVPNPSTAATQVLLDHPARGTERFVLEVFNAQGTAMAVRATGSLAEDGRARVWVDGAGWPAGMYTIRCVAGGQVASEVWLKTP